MKGYHITLVAVGLGLLGAFCLRPPALPHWDTTVTVPLYSSIFRVVDLMDSTRFKGNPDSSIQFAWSDSLDRITVDGAVDVLDSSGVSRITLRDLMFTGLPRVSSGCGLEELLGRPLPDTAVKMRVEPFSTTAKIPVELPDIETARVVSGVFELSIRNNTSLPFDSVSVELPFARVAFGAVGPRSAMTRRLPLGESELVSPVAVRLTVGSPGAGDTAVLQKTDSMLVELTLDSLVLAAGRLRLPEGEGRRECRVELATSRPFRVDSLIIRSGYCRIRLDNSFPVPVETRLLVPGLGQNPVRVVPARGEAIVELDLAGCRVDNRSQGNCLFEFEVIALPRSTGEPVEVSETDRLTIAWQPEGIEPALIAGEFLRPVYVATRLETLPGLLPRGVRGVRVPEADIVLDLVNSAGFPLELLLDLVAHRDGREVRRESKALLLPRSGPSGPSRTSHILSVTDLINSGPDILTLEHTTRLLGRGLYRAGEGLSGRATMSTPLRMAFETDTILGPGHSVKLSDEHRRLIRNHLVEAEVTVRISNHLPAPFAGWLRLAGEPVGPDERPGMILGRKSGTLLYPMAIPAGFRDRHGNCTYPADTSLVFRVDSLDSRLLAGGPLDARLLIGLLPTDTFNFRTIDGLSIDALLTLRARVGR